MFAQLGQYLFGFVNYLTARPIYVGGHQALVMSIFGDQFYVDTRDRSVGRTLMVRRSWELGVTRALRKLVRSGAVVADVGANVGWHTVRMARRTGRGGRVVAFEANPDVVGLLGRNVQINGMTDRVTVVPKAAYSTTGPLEFQVYAELKGGSSVFGTQGSAAHFHDTMRAVTVEGIRLDDHFAPGTRVDLIHADVEGSEPHVVRGAERVIRDNPHIVLVLEYSPVILASSGISVREFNADLERHGFTPYALKRSGRLVRTSYTDLAAGGHCDIVLRRQPKTRTGS